MAGSPNCLLGIDSGLTVCKVAAFDEDGGQLAAAARAVRLSTPRKGWSECDLERVWQDAGDAIREVLTVGQVDPAKVAGISCTGHGNGLYLLDGAGRMLRPGITSMDARAGSVAAELRDSGTGLKMRRQNGQGLWPGQTISLLKWLKVNEPSSYDSASLLLCAKDYLHYRLTGKPASDWSEMSKVGLIDLGRKAWAAEVLAMLEVEEIARALPPVVDSGTVIGAVTREAGAATGLLAGTPVVAGCADVDACALGAGVIERGQACLITGTWSINEVVSDQPVYADSIFGCSLFAVPGRYLCMEASPTSASNLEWFITQFCDPEQREAAGENVSVYEICNRKVAATSPGESGIVFLPFLFGSSAHPQARGSLIGMASWHSRGHLLRAVYEGVAFSQKWHVDRLQHAGPAVRSARLTGGGAKSTVWAQMFADVNGFVGEVTEAQEVGALGAALCAGVGVGLFASFASGAGRMVRVRQQYSPDAAAHATYMRKYAIYRKITEQLRDVWDDMAD